MAAPCNTAGQRKNNLTNCFDGLRIVLPTPAASRQQVHPKIRAFDGLIKDPTAPAELRVALPTPTASGQQVHPGLSAFDGLMIEPTAPAESSHGREHLPYAVFINHRGEDTKHRLANSIYNKFGATGLRVFLDKNELELGDYFPEALQEAMRSSPVHVAIFSENYAQSPWCLAELAFILKLPHIKFIPICYHVEYSTLRWAIKEKGNYANALNSPEMKSRYSSEMIQSWKLALHKASFYTGETIRNQSEEEKALMNVVSRVLKELKKVTLNVAKHAVGLAEAEQDFHNKISLQSAAGPTQIVGIWGMGGAGKTTLAKQLYNNKCFTMRRSSFLFDVRQAARQELLHEKQKELLKDLQLLQDLGSTDLKHVDQGKEILRSRLRSVRVLIVLDDVDHTNQLDALLPALDSLGQGSLIIVTTRELHVLKARRISAIYKIRTLNPSHAKQLFCWHAFGQPSPLSGFEELAQKFIDDCRGLPLSLVVLGSELCGEYRETWWQAQLHQLSKTIPDDIKLRLKISYDALDEEEKEMFLDVACFLVGYSSSRAIAVWDGSGWSGLLGVRKLVNKSLVELDEKDFRTFIRMHEHLRNFGREIANQRSPYRLCCKRQIINIPPQEGVIRIRGMADAFGENCYPLGGKIKLITSQGERILQPGSLGLKIFSGNGGDFINEERSELSSELLYLRYDRFEHRRFPSWLSLKKLRVLELNQPQILEYLWEGDVDVPSQLKELYIFEGYKLEKIESLEGLRSLETLIINDCKELNTLPSLAEATSLKRFELKNCNKLEKIENLESIRSLKTLIIHDCIKLNPLPSLAELTSLEELNFKICHKLKIEGLERLTSLKKLVVHTRSKSLEHSERLKSLVVVANARTNVIQEWPGKVIICRRAVIDVDSVKNFFTSFPLNNVVEYGSSGGLTLSMPESAANAILICFVIDYFHPESLFHISTDRGDHFYTEMSDGRWLWMGVFPEGSEWLQSKRYEIQAFSEDGEVKVEAWLLMGKEQSILEAFHQLSQS